MTVNVAIQSNTGTYQGGTFQLGPLSIASAFASLQVNSLTFSGASFISTTGPSGAYGVLIEPPSNNQVSLTLKGVTGDTGIPLNPGMPTLLSFGNITSTTNVGLTSGGAITGVVTLSFF